MGASFFLYAGRASWQLVILAVIVAAAFFGMRNVPDVQSLPLNLITSAALSFIGGVGLISAIVGIVGSLTRPLERAQIQRHAFVGLGIWIVLGLLGGGGFLFMRQRVQKANTEARNAYEKEVAQIESDAPDVYTRTQKMSETLLRAAQASTGTQKTTFEVAASGMSSRLAPLQAYENAWKQVEEAGGADPTASPLKTKDEIEARRALFDTAVSATKKYQDEWDEVLARWQVLGNGDDPLMKKLVISVMERQPAHKRELECRLAWSHESLAVLDLLDAQRGFWRMAKGKPVFNRKKVGVRYKLHQETLLRIEQERVAARAGKVSESSLCTGAANAKIAKVTPTAAEGTPMPTDSAMSRVANLQPIEATKAVSYARSYVTLIRRGNFEEAYRYMPKFVAVQVSPQEHAVYWTNAAGPSRENLSIGDSHDLGDAVAYEVEIPDRKAVSVAVLQIDGKVYTVPEEFLPK